jgi:nucleoside-diphosphate-sugar epimerase
MTHPILVTGAAGGPQGSTGRQVANLLMEQGIPVRAFVHKLDSRSDELRKQGAEVVGGDLLNPASVQAAMRNVKRAYFTYPVADGLLEAATIFVAAARDAAWSWWLIIRSFRVRRVIRPFAIYDMHPAFAICSIGWPIAFSTGRTCTLFISRRRPTLKTCALL